jgi:dinuclear metal center YbgI/SA1388 family protein
MDREQLGRYLYDLFQPDRLRDYCPNGLQVEGRSQINTVVLGVTACHALIEAAIACHADALIVHHGYFWRNEGLCVTGIRRQRLKRLLSQDINLFAYHLPLDVHPSLGNNAQFAQRMAWTIDAHWGEQNLGCLTRTKQAMTVPQLLEQLTTCLGRVPLSVGSNGGNMVRCIAWCTGAAQAHFEQAIAAGAEVYISGEISESTVHLARESGVTYIAAGHHATERFGVMALAENLRQFCGLDAHFIDIDNPV